MAKGIICGILVVLAIAFGVMLFRDDTAGLDTGGEELSKYYCFGSIDAPFSHPRMGDWVWLQLIPAYVLV